MVTQTAPLSASLISHKKLSTKLKEELLLVVKKQVLSLTS